MVTKLSIPYEQRPNFTSTYRGLTPVQHSVLNVKAIVGTFNQEKALVGAFSVIVQLHRLIDLRHQYKPHNVQQDECPNPLASLLFTNAKNAAEAEQLQPSSGHPEIFVWTRVIASFQCQRQARSFIIKVQWQKLPLLASEY